MASGQAAQGERVLSAALSQVDASSTAAIRTQTQLANIQNRGTSPGAAVRRKPQEQHSGVIGPAALATAAIAVTTRTVYSPFGMPSTSRSSSTPPTSRSQTSYAACATSGRTFKEAQAFARPLQADPGRNQRDPPELDRRAAHLDQQRQRAGVGALSVFRSRNPAKPISEAPGHYASWPYRRRHDHQGNFRCRRRLDALRMKNEIAGGADAVQVLSQLPRPMPATAWRC